MNPQDFVAKWRKIVEAEATPGKRAGELKLYQQHFLDLCALVGHPTPAQLDPDQVTFMFEAGVVKATGSHGRADVWFKEHFAFEYKDVDGDLDWAYLQLLQYRDSLHNPPLLVTSNFARLVIHPNFTNVQSAPVVVTLDDLLTPPGLEAVRALFYAPDWFRPEQRAIRVTEEAARTFAGLADYLRKWGHAPHAVAHYLIRLLFALFAEDSGLLPDGLVTRMVERGKHNPKQFNRQLQQLFGAMAVGDTFGEFAIDWFNGGLFTEEAADDASIDLDADALVLLDRVTTLDWSAMEPAILGTLFTRSLDPKQRSRLGAQYTSRADILLIVEPVLLAPLRREWAAVQATATAAAERRNTAASQKERVQAQKELERLIDGFFDRLATVRVLDPACGSGNFLYVALLLLLDLWLEVRAFGGHLGMNMRLPLEGLAPHPRQLYGIEVNDYAHELASTTVWIGYLQWLHQHGFGFQRNPVLEPLDNIRQLDAILGYDAEGRPVEPEWPAAEVIVGNPPFLGIQRLRTELGDPYVEALFALYKGKVPARADLVCYWFSRAVEQLEQHKVERVGLIATQAIRSQRNRAVLEAIKSVGDIFEAWSNRPWVLDGAAIRVAMVCFDRGIQQERLLDGKPVSNINADLTTSLDFSVAARLPENIGIGFEGIKKNGPFELTRQDAIQLLDSSANEPGISNPDVIKPWLNGRELVQHAEPMWLLDFGIETPIETAAKYVLPFRYADQVIRPERQKSSDKWLREHWWLFERPRPAMRAAIQPLARYIVTPRVAKHRVFVWVDGRVIPDGRLNVFAREDDYFFGVLQSHCHTLWALRHAAMHGKGNDPTYNNRISFETYPFPWPPGQEPAGDPRVEAIAAAARDLVAQRAAWLNPPGLPEPSLAKRTLTNLYNERPAWLAAAHARLDAAVLAAYGWPAGLGDEEVLARLLALNQQRMASGNG